MASPIESLIKRTAALIGLCLLMLSPLALQPISAQAGQFRSTLCAGNNGSNGFGTATNTTSPSNPGGIFNFTNACGPAPDPAGDNALLRISENQPNGNAGTGAFGQVFWDAPPFVHFHIAGGYTRQLSDFNEGWRSRFLGVDLSGGTFQIITQGLGLPNSGGQANTSNTFGPHLWPFGNALDFRRFIFEMTCVRPTGCDRSGSNSTDINTLRFTMSDDQDSQVSLTGAGDPFASGEWGRGGQTVTWDSADNGSGLRFERVLIDNAVKHTIDYQAAGACDTNFTQASGEFARRFQPCPTGGPFHRGWPLDTASLGDGPHALAVCTQDYGQFQGLNGTGGQTCANRTIRTDNTAPGAPAGLEVTSANPARYLDHFGAHWSLPPNEGSPISKIHYEILDGDGTVVVPERTASGTDLSQLSDIVDPSKSGDYLRLWLEDAVGFVGPATKAPIPHDTTPPAAPQTVSVVAPTTKRSTEGFDVRWQNITDNGSPIDAAHYKVVDAAGNVIIQTQTVPGQNVNTIRNLDAPGGRGEWSLKLWLSDEEGNVGAPTTVPLSYVCSRSKVDGGERLETGLGAASAQRQVVHEGIGTLLKGKLADAQGAGVQGASLCVFSRVITDGGREFLGEAISDRDGGFEFTVQPGPSRELTSAYRSGHREIEEAAQLRTIVHPTFKAKKKVIYDSQAAVFFGSVPGPHNDRVVVALEVGVGKGHRKGGQAFHRYSTREGGNYRFSYRFKRVSRPTSYLMWAEVRPQSGYPYIRGKSRKPVRITVLPRRR